MLYLPLHFLQCDSAGTVGGSGVMGDPHHIGKKFQASWLPYFCRSV